MISIHYQEDLIQPSLTWRATADTLGRRYCSFMLDSHRAENIVGGGLWRVQWFLAGFAHRNSVATCCVGLHCAASSCGGMERTPSTAGTATRKLDHSDPIEVLEAAVAEGDHLKHLRKRPRADHEGQGEWVCTQCTFINKTRSLCCKMCQAPPNEIELWPCLVCTYLNQPSAARCAACRSQRSEPQSISHPGVAAGSSGRSNVRSPLPSEKQRARLVKALGLREDQLDGAFDYTYHGDGAK